MCAAVAVMSAALMVPLTEQSAPTVTLAFPDARLVTAGTSFEPERVICWAPVAPIALSARSIIPQPPATAATAAATEVTSHVLFIAFSSCWGDYPLRDRQIGRAHGLNSSHSQISYAVFCLKKKKKRLVDLLEADEVDVTVDAASGDDHALAGDHLYAATNRYFEHRI